MARQRMIKPEFFDSESLAECSVAARLAFIGLWVEADDYGRLKAQFTRLRKRIFPYDNISARKFTAIIEELESVGCIEGYEVDGEKYISIPNFSVYQYVKKPSRSTIPEYQKQYSSPLVPHYDGTGTHERKKERSSSDLSKVTTTKEVASSGAESAKAAPLNASKVPICPECGKTLKAYCYHGNTEWRCKDHGTYQLGEAVIA